MRLITLFLISYVFIFSVSAREITDSVKSTRSGALKIFIDCIMFDVNYFKENIKFVNYVRDTKEAEVHVLFTEQETGSGGNEFTITFLGLQKFDKMNDTIKFNTDADFTDDEERAMALKFLKMGLMKYVIRTPLGKQIEINYQSQEKDNESETVTDKWDNWVFSTNIGGWFQGEASVTNSNVWGSFTAKRITPGWKIINTVSSSYNEGFYIIDDTTNVTSENNSWGIRNLTVKSLTDHWSAGGGINCNSSTYNNIKLKSTLSPSVEYNLFKYSESTRKQLRFLYALGGSFVQYNDTTIFDKVEEILYYQSLGVAFQYIEKWGSLSLSVSGSQYLHDLAKNSVDVYGSFNVRIFKGLSIGMSGGFTFLHDQLALPKEGATGQEILLRIKQLQTTYSYWNNININYTFGSIYNNVVNPRFGEE